MSTETVLMTPEEVAALLGRKPREKLPHPPPPPALGVYVHLEVNLPEAALKKVHPFP